MNATASHTGPFGRSTDPQMDSSARMLLLRGIVAILFGILAAAWPGLTLIWLVALFAVYAIVLGAVSVAAAIRVRRSDSKWWLPLLIGIVSIVAGVYAIAYPGVTTLVLVLVMGVNALLTGALDIALAIRLRRVLRGQWLMVASGIVSVLFGVLVIAAPGAGALALVWLISLHAIVTGALLLALGLRTRRAIHTGEARPLASGGR
jgi:uncharacterized membrane protein HdeD (DUF308 family)